MENVCGKVAGSSYSIENHIGRGLVYSVFGLLLAAIISLLAPPIDAFKAIVIGVSLVVLLAYVLFYLFYLKQRRLILFGDDRFILSSDVFYSEVPYRSLSRVRTVKLLGIRFLCVDLKDTAAYLNSLNRDTRQRTRWNLRISGAPILICEFGLRERQEIEKGLMRPAML